MTRSLLDTLEAFSNALGVSGNESEIRDVVLTKITPQVDSVMTDALGNLIATKKGSKDSPRLVLSAHLDEVGFQITHIEKSGFLRFAKVGGMDDRTLLAKPLVVGPKRIPGVIGSRPIHLLYKKEGHRQVAKSDDLYIDIGARDREDAQRVVEAGDFAAFATRFEDLGHGFVKGKALDDRVGCALLALVLEEDLPLSLTAVFSTQEEVGLRGATVAGHRTAPQVMLALEGTFAGDFPQERDLSRAAVIGQGPVLTHRDASAVGSPWLLDLLVETAERERIPFQFKRPLLGGTDAGRMHLARGGAHASVISVPSRYIHSPVAVAKIEDIENAYRLAKAAIRAIATKDWPM
jgi:endoglucanase